MRKLSTLSASVALVLAGTPMAAFAPSASAITGNYQEDFEHDYVGLIAFYTDPDPETGDPFSHRCSGTLISPTVMVTAGHCTEGVDSGRVYFQQAVGPNYDPDAFGGLGGDPTTGYPYEGGVTFSRADNYGFHDFEGYPDTQDVGVVVLDEPFNPPSGEFGVLPDRSARSTHYLASSRASKQNLRFRHRRLRPARPGPGSRSR